MGSNIAVRVELISPKSTLPALKKEVRQLGVLPAELPWQLAQANPLQWRLGVRIGAIVEEDTGTYDLTVEEDVLLGSNPQHDAARLQALLSRVVEQADRLEQEYLPGYDRSLDFFLDDLEKDFVDAR